VVEYRIGNSVIVQHPLPLLPLTPSRQWRVNYYVKVNYPRKEGLESKEIFKEAIMSAGRTKVVCAGGASEDVELFLRTLHDQIHISGAAGSTTGRNIHQKSLKEAIRMCNAIYAIKYRRVKCRASIEDLLFKIGLAYNEKTGFAAPRTKPVEP
jgi:hypothetical protein